jgi:PIN domain
MRDHGPLIFVDTNIFLDFYRATGSANFRLLDRIKQVKERLIISHQVEMEFRKNRQNLISDAVAKLRFGWPSEIPALFVDTEELKELTDATKVVDEKLQVLRDRLTGALSLPVDDPVHKSAIEVFSLDSPFNLTRTKEVYNRILRHARRRFSLGYPPRKGKDDSMGDAVNWEWIIECASTSKRSVIIVSRDNDYGLTFDRVRHLNEWLHQEFGERVGGKSKVELTDSLAAALKEAKVRVTKAEEKAEEELILETRRREADGLAKLLQDHSDVASKAEILSSNPFKEAIEQQKQFTEMMRAATSNPFKEAIEQQKQFTEMMRAATSNPFKEAIEQQKQFTEMMRAATSNPFKEAMEQQKQFAEMMRATTSNPFKEAMEQQKQFAEMMRAATSNPLKEILERQRAYIEALSNPALNSDVLRTAVESAKIAKQFLESQSPVEKTQDPADKPNIAPTEPAQ